MKIPDPHTIKFLTNNSHFTTVTNSYTAPKHGTYKIRLQGHTALIIYTENRIHSDYQAKCYTGKTTYFQCKPQCIRGERDAVM